jgi:predicted nucleic acid-binding protein
LYELFRRLPIVDLTPSAKQAVITIRRARVLKLPDAIVAATAIAANAELVTADQQFQRVPGLRVRLVSPTNS